VYSLLNMLLGYIGAPTNNSFVDKKTWGLGGGRMALAGDLSGC